MNKNFQVFILLNTNLSFSPFFLHFLHFSLLVHRQTDPGDLNSDFSNPNWVLICYMEEKKNPYSSADAQRCFVKHTCHLLTLRHRRTTAIPSMSARSPAPCGRTATVMSSTVCRKGAFLRVLSIRMRDGSQAVTGIYTIHRLFPSAARQVPYIPALPKPKQTATR